jgi:hypothetical protein
MPCDGALESCSTPVRVLGLLLGLTPRTTYHYRFVAENALGRVYGADRAFKTITGRRGGRVRTLLSTAAPAGYATAPTSVVTVTSTHRVRLRIHVYTIYRVLLARQSVTLTEGSRRLTARTDRAGIVTFTLTAGFGRTVTVRFAGTKRYAPATRTLSLTHTT